VMDSFSFFVTMDNITSPASGFRPLPLNEQLPFPLNAGFHNKLLIIIYLITNFILGCLLRFNIISFTHSLNGNENPINLFIWYDQLNGIFMALNIVYTLTILHLPFPLSSIIGNDACNMADLIGNLYLFGQAVWSCFIAVYRVFYIRFQNLFSSGIKTSRFIFLLSFLGHTFIISSATTIAYYDKGILFKMCTHSSVEKVAILKVSKIK